MQGVNASLVIHREKLIGEGGFSVVYAGTYGDVQVAVKAFKTKGKLRLEAIEKEAAISAKLRHPNIVNFWGKAIDPTNANPVLIFECLGISLENAILEEPAPLNVLRNKWLLGIAHAIKYLHEQNPPIIHRDLKPDNILI
ncbi:hypothetical protein HDU79_005130, partial [Rhizoclosmatium sp. JEL0117]